MLVDFVDLGFLAVGVFGLRGFERRFLIRVPERASVRLPLRASYKGFP